MERIRPFDMLETTELDQPCQNHYIIAVVGGDWPVLGCHVTAEAGTPYLSTVCR
jgi:hypothetical protein